jgi:hypothetical protein
VRGRGGSHGKAPPKARLNFKIAAHLRLRLQSQPERSGCRVQVILRASDLGMTAEEDPAALDANKELKARLRAIWVSDHRVVSAQFQMVSTSDPS